MNIAVNRMKFDPPLRQLIPTYTAPIITPTVNISKVLVDNMITPIHTSAVK